MRTSFLTLVAAALATACGGSSSSSTVQGLGAPSQITIVTPVDQTAPPGRIVLPASTPGFSQSTDYFQDSQEIHVYDPALEPLQQINEILCYLAQTGARELVNKGAYLAQVDTSICAAGSSGGSSGSQTGQSSAASEEIQIWTIESSRSDNVSAQNIHLWVPSGDPNSPETIFVDLALTRSPSSENPFGQFAMDFASSDTYANLGSPSIVGTLGTVLMPSIGEVGFQFYENRGDITQVPAVNTDHHRVQVNVEMNEDQESGWARILNTMRYDFGGGDSGILTNEFHVAFDDTHFMTSTDGGPDVAFQRGTYEENVWRYGLYYADGANAGSRVEMNEGFGFRTQGGDYGWIGYYGAWIPPGVTVNHGDTVTRDVYSSTSTQTTSYTAFRAPGKLVRYSKETLALTAIEDRTFEWWTWDPNTGVTTVYLVQYFNTSSEWHKVATLDPNTYRSTALAPTEMIDTSAYGMLDMWSDGLGGQVAFVDGETSITFFEQEFVNADDAVFNSSTTLNLQGFVQALKSGITSAEADLGDVFLADAPDVVTPHLFELHQSDLTLYHDTDGMGTLAAVGLATGNAPTTGPNTWGMTSGPLVTAAEASSLTSIWDVWSASEFYIYETGHNDWNQFFGLRDSNNMFATFDTPLTFTYMHSTADDRNDDATYDGQTFLLQYQGFGDLGGLPFEGVDLNNNGTFDRYYPVCSLDDGTLLTDDGGTNYVVRGLDVEQVLQPDPTYSGTLDTSQAAGLVLPDGSNYQTPTIGVEPTVTDPPRVIDGEVIS